MKPLGIAGLVLAFSLFSDTAAAQSRHFWQINSPSHGQTFVFGTERSRVWMQSARDRDLTLVLKYTNDPYVNSDYPRRYDTFFFPFPGITLGKDNVIFYYRTPSGRSIPVAEKRPNFLGIDEVKLLPNADLVVESPHGYLTARLDVADPVSR